MWRKIEIENKPTAYSRRERAGLNFPHHGGESSVSPAASAKGMLAIVERGVKEERVLKMPEDDPLEGLQDESWRE